MSETKPGVSFAFSSKKKHDNVKLTQSKLLDTTQETREETDFVKTVEHNKINGYVAFPATKYSFDIHFLHVSLLDPSKKHQKRNWLFLL